LKKTIVDRYAFAVWKIPTKQYFTRLSERDEFYSRISVVSETPENHIPVL